MILIKEGRKKFWHPTEMARAGPSRKSVHTFSGVYTNYQALTDIMRKNVIFLHVFKYIFFFIKQAFSLPPQKLTSS